MTRPILASGLLKTAFSLAGSGAGAGRPALADLRRATSTAYYALFHQVVRHGAFAFLPNGSEDEIAHIARWFTHTGILDAAGLVLEAEGSRSLEQIRKADRAAVMAIRSSSGGEVPSQLVLVADAFQSLQEARHRADYDGNYDPVRLVAMNHVQEADAAVRATWQMWSSDGTNRADRRHWWPTYECFLKLALLKSGGPRGR